MQKLLLFVLLTTLLAKEYIPKIGDKFDYANNPEWKFVNEIDGFMWGLMSEIDSEIQKILNPDLFMIDLVFVIYETTKIDTIHSDSLSLLTAKLEEKYFESVSHYKLSNNLEYYHAKAGIVSDLLY